MTGRTRVGKVEWRGKIWKASRIRTPVWNGCFPDVQLQPLKEARLECSSIPEDEPWRRVVPDVDGLWASGCRLNRRETILVVRLRLGIVGCAMDMQRKFARRLRRACSTSSRRM
jgi:hypothetical protein